MDLRKPEFTRTWGFMGPCVIYPVSVHVGGRQWEHRMILVSVKAYEEGVRAFPYVTVAGTTVERHAVSAKVERKLDEAVRTCKEYFRKLDELHAVQKRLVEIGNDYIIPYDPALG